MNKTTMNHSEPETKEISEDWLIKAEGFAFDVVAQLQQLREKRNLNQVDLAALVGTRQQAISLMESAGYDRHSLSKLREIAAALDSFVDVVLVPQERLAQYLEWRYQPVFFEEPTAKVRLGEMGEVLQQQWASFASVRAQYTGRIAGASSYAMERRRMTTTKYTGPRELGTAAGEAA